jgi:glucan phosphoethanolaminetransferase (alkaline phosphatase superfamily)
LYDASYSITLKQKDDMNTNELRKLATPLTIGSFALMATTGVLMFFHVQLGIIKDAHEWLSWLFLAAVGLHIYVNFTVFKRYFTQKPALAIMAVCLILLFAAMLFPQTGGGKRGGPQQINRVLLEAPLNSVAALTGKTAEALQTQLQAQGLQVDANSQNLKQIADDNQRNPMEVLNKALQ